MAIDKLPTFRNIVWDYKTNDDSFVGRGLHLNMLNDVINNIIDEVNTLIGGGGGGSYVFENGLTETDGTVTLGGDILQSTTFNMDAKSWSINGYDNQASPTMSSKYSQGTHYITMYSSSYSGGEWDETAQFWAQYEGATIGRPGVTMKAHKRLPSNDETHIRLSVGGITVLDENNSVGITYEADYSTNGTLNDRWIPDYGAVKAYADSVGGGSYTFGNGLTEAGGTVSLGGSLTDIRTIDGNAATVGVVIENDNTTSTSTRATFREGTINLQSYNATGHSVISGYALVYVQPTGIVIEQYSGGNRIININNTQGMLITDGIDSRGLVYAADYSTAGTANARWLPDWAAVTTQIGGNDVNALITTPTVTQDGYAVTWDNTAGEYTLTAVSGGSVSFGSQYEIPYMNAGGTDFLYDSGFQYQAGLLLVGTADTGVSLTGSTLYILQGSTGYSTIDQQNWGNTAGLSNLVKHTKIGGTYGAWAAAPTDAQVIHTAYQVYDGTATRAAGDFYFSVDGAVATDNFNTEMEWWLKVGASASTAKMRLDSGGLQLHDYGGGTITGTATYALAVDSAGNIIETALGGGGVSVLNQANNRIVTVTGTTDVLTGESNLLFDGTDMSIALAGKINFRSTSNYINSSTTGQLDFNAASTYVWRIATSPEVTLNVSQFYCNTNEGISLGQSTSSRWLYGYFYATYADIVYVEDSTHYISTSTTNLTFRDEVNTTPVTLSTLVNKSDVSVANQSDNRVITATGTTDALNAEANMTFNGSTLAVTGAITATGEITAYSSDIRLKKNILPISDPLEKIQALNGVTFGWNDVACRTAGFAPVHEIETGFIAQNLRSVIEDAVALAPFDNDGFGNSVSGEEYLTTKPEKVIPLLVEAVKALTKKVELLENK